MTPEQAQYLDEVEARAKAATPKTWKAASSWRPDSYSVENEQGWLIAEVDDGGMSLGDAEFIAHSRTDVERLTALARAYDEAFESLRPGSDGHSRFLTDSTIDRAMHEYGLDKLP